MALYSADGQDIKLEFAEINREIDADKQASMTKAVASSANFTTGGKTSPSFFTCRCFKLDLEICLALMFF